MHLPNRLGDNGRCDRVSHSPASHAISLGQCIYRYGPVTHSVERRNRNVLLAVIKYVLVDLVGHGDRVPFVALLADQLEFPAGEYLARRIIWSVYNDRLGIVVERRGELRRIDRPVRWMKRDESRSGARKNRIRAVILIEWLKYNDLVARVDDGHQGRHHRFGRTAGDRYLTLGIYFHSDIPRSLLGNCISEVFGAPCNRILVYVRHDGVASRKLDLLRRREIRKYLGQVYCAMHLGLASHLPDH